MKLLGSDFHHVPAAFEELGKVASNHQYSYSPYAHDKMGFCLFRTFELGAENNEKLFAQKLHAHSFAALNVFLAATLKGVMAADEIKKGRLKNAFALASVSRFCSLHDYVYTSEEPTLYMGEHSDKEMILSHIRLSL